MLALVTCHIFPPQSDTEKMNSWHLTSRLTARSFSVHGFTSAVRQMPTAMRNPFAWTNVSSGKNSCFAIWPHVGTKFFNLSQHFLSMDGWPGDAIFFLWGQPLKIIRKNSAKKRSSPLDFYFWHLRLGLFKSLFWLVKLNMCVCTLLQGQLYFQLQKTCVLQFGRALTQNSWIRPIMSYQWMIGLVMRLFSCGPTCEIIRKYSVKKGPAPWIWFLTPAPLPLEVTFLVGEGEHMWLYPFCKVI